MSSDPRSKPPAKQIFHFSRKATCKSDFGHLEQVGGDSQLNIELLHVETSHFLLPGVQMTATSQ